jgi:formamidopyrimidine-DNA glycosylase
MPELPEVELYARYFAEHALDQQIARVRVLDPRILGTPKAKLVRTLEGRAFTRVRRHGKHLFAEAGDAWLHLHFGMTGDLAYDRDDEEAPRFARLVFEFAGGAHLAFEDMRLFGVVSLTPDPEAYVAEHRLGPDPLDPSFRLGDFRRVALRRKRLTAKGLLMAQDAVAGVGNLYADETLYRASIHPLRRVDALNAAEVKSIFTTLRRLLTDVIGFKARGDDYPARYLIPHREEEARCPRCGGEIARTVVGGRTTYYCSRHQRRR